MSRIITGEQLASIVTAQKQLLDLGDEKTAATLAWALTDEPVADDEVLVALKRPEGYEEVHPQMVSMYAIGDRWPEYRTITKES